MDCRRVEALISPYMDGELSPQETAALRAHLSVCASCGQEYETLRQISAACQNIGKISLTAPAGFKDALMQRIKEENAPVIPRTYSNWLHPSWKQAAAGIAAAVMLALGTLSMNPGPMVQIAEKFPAIYQPDSNVPGASSPIDNGPASPTRTETPVGTQNNNPSPTVAQGPVDKGSTAGVFLNKERFITTTLLKVQVADSAAALEQAVNMAAGVQAQTLNLGQQVDANGAYTAVKITASKSLAPSLAAELAKLGTVSGQEVDKNDITMRYADTLSQYQTLITQRAALQDESQKAILDERIDALAVELQNWEQQAEQETIVLWLE